MEETLIVYQTNQITGEYIGETDAMPDQMDPGNWLIPGGCYVDAPPEKIDGKAIIRSADKLSWEYIADNRGPAYSKIDLTEVNINYLGALPDDLTKIPPPSRYYKWVDGAWKLDDSVKSAEVRYERDSLLAEFYDKAILMALRELRMVDPSDTSKTLYIKGKISELDSYAVSLQGIPDQVGFPFEITWPEKPVR